MQTFATLTPRPADALLGIMAAYRADPRDTKTDLGVGVYKDSRGSTPIMQAVSLAEARLATSEGTKAYEGQRGNVAFCEAIEGLLLGETLAELKPRMTSYTTPGGCGALGVGAALIKRLNTNANVWISDPSWPNHKLVIESAGLKSASHPYLDAQSGEIDFDALKSTLTQNAKSGDGIIIQGPCHNPTGCDFSVAQWEEMADLCNDIELTPFLDIAYHGFGRGLDEDLAGARAFLKKVPNALISYSCSKNFGLYRERTGCLLALAETEAGALAAGSHIAEISRGSYSMPPSHGAGIVATIMGDAELTELWMTELTQMRDRMLGLRAQLASTLLQKTGDNRLGVLANGNGMFSQLPVSKDAVSDIAKSEGLYMPLSGRINIAGLPEQGIDTVADQLARILS